MLNELYNSLCSFPEERFLTEDPLSETVVDILKDLICLNIPNIICKDSPAECKKCSQVFCARCIEMVIKSDAKCPNCREYLQVRKMNRYLKEILAKVKMRCHFNGDGCQVALPLEQLVAHESQCEYDSSLCPNDCGQRIIKKHLEDHLTNLCSNQLIKCKYPYCTTRLLKDHLVEHEASCEYRVDLAEQLEEQKQEPEEEKSFEICLEEHLPGQDRPSHRFRVNQEDALSEVKSSNGENWRNIYFNVNSSYYKPEANDESNRLVSCKYPGCYVAAPGQTITNHEEVCSYKPQECKNHLRGCDYKANKYELISHERGCKYIGNAKPVVPLTMKKVPDAGSQKQDSGRKQIFDEADDFGHKSNQSRYKSYKPYQPYQPYQSKYNYPKAEVLGPSSLAKPRENSHKNADTSIGINRRDQPLSRLEYRPQSGLPYISSKYSVITDTNQKENRALHYQ